jgi:hypothetical protein
MAKQKKQKSGIKKPSARLVPEKSFLDRLDHPRYILGFFIILFIIIAFLYEPLVFKGMAPNGSDFISDIGVTKQLTQWQEKTGHFPLWNPYMFGGMPIYQHFGPRAWSIDNLLISLKFLGSWQLWYFLAGALGMFLLVRFLGLSAITAMISTLAFILMPHFQALIIVGHFAKFRALMWMPYVLLTFLYLVRKRNLLAGLLFSLAFTIQFRTQHYQIIFYTLLLLLFFAIPPLYRFIREKNWKAIAQLSSLSVMAVVLAFLIAAQIFLSIKGYTPYSTRGGYAISLKSPEQNLQEKKGVGFDYATMWSYSVDEFWNLIIAKFHGGTSNEMYTGNAVPAFRNRELPTYWGDLPFTQSYEYMGILIIFLAMIGIVMQWDRWEIKSLTFLTILALLMSLGKNFPVLYKTLFFYVPYFDKFRAPVMVLTLVMFNVTLLAAYGISFLLKADLNKKEISSRFYFVSGLFLFLLVVPLLFGSSFALTHGDEAKRYGQEVLNLLKKVRLEMLRDSDLKSLVLLLIGAGSIFAVKKSRLKRDYMPLIIIVLIAFDFLQLDSHYLKGKFVDPKVIEQQKYQQTVIDKKILSDPQLKRVFPFGQLFSDVHWVYYHQSIGGYSPAKLEVIQEIIENCLYAYLEDDTPINWNILKILNVKYMVTPQVIQNDRLQPIAQEESRSQYVYLYTDALPRAWFVDDYTIIKDGVERLTMLNSPAFEPRTTAILEEKPEDEISAPDSSDARVVDFQPQKLVLQTYSDKSALLVLSEIYYPPGWKAVMDGKVPLKIYKTDHLVRSVVLPPGQHTVEFIFRPVSYYTGLTISIISIVVLYLLLIILLYREYGHIITQKWGSHKNIQSQD